MNDINTLFLQHTEKPHQTISPVHEIVAEMRAGRMVVLVDEEDRENEGDLVMAAQFVSAEHINFMAMHGRGLICLTLTEARCQQLGLAPMVKRNGTKLGTNFTASIEAATGVTTGISTADRARTIQAAVGAQAAPADIVSPGHVFPLMAQEGGVLVRAGHTEAGCDLAKMAGLEPAAVICEILTEDGEMARLPDLLQFAANHALKIGTIADLIAYRSQTERLVNRVAERMVQTAYGYFRLVAFHDDIANETHLALVKGDIHAADHILVRVHKPLSVLDLLDVSSATHSWSLASAMHAIAAAGTGVIVLLRNAESSEQLLQAIAQTEESTSNRHTLKDYGIGAQILRELGVVNMRLMGEPRKIPSMAGFGLEIIEFLSAY